MRFFGESCKPNFQKDVNSPLCRPKKIPGGGSCCKISGRLAERPQRVKATQVKTLVNREKL
jgi:hypothetical protein